MAGFFCLPLKKDYPTGKPYWKQGNCPYCGQTVWLPAGAEEILRKNKKACACTECNLRVRINK